MIALIQNMSTQRAEELRATGARRRKAARARRGAEGYAARMAAFDARVTIRRLRSDGADREAIARVAGRDSASVPAGELLGAELDGTLVAALALGGGEVVADPFTPTAEVLLLLRRRAELLRGAAKPHGRRLRGRLMRRPGALRP
jgi:hypothetical protein